MDESLQNLLDLQDKDLRIHAIQDQLRVVPREKEEVQTQLQAAERRAAEAHDGVIEREKAIKTTEIAIETLQQKLRDFLGKTTMIKDNTEYRAALEQIEQIKQEISTLEDRELELLDELDHARGAETDARKELERVHARVKEMLNDLDIRIQNFTAALEQPRAERARVAETVPAALRARYERLRKSPLFAKRPIVVPVRDGICDGCHMRVTAQVAVNARKGQLTACENCGALLYDEA